MIYLWVAFVQSSLLYTFYSAASTSKIGIVSFLKMLMVYVCFVATHCSALFNISVSHVFTEPFCPLVLFWQDGIPISLPQR